MKDRETGLNRRLSAASDPRTPPLAGVAAQEAADPSVISWASASICPPGASSCFRAFITDSIPDNVASVESLAPQLGDVGHRWRGSKASWVTFAASGKVRPFPAEPSSSPSSVSANDLAPQHGAAPPPPASPATFSVFTSSIERIPRRR